MESKTKKIAIGVSLLALLLYFLFGRKQGTTGKTIQGNVIGEKTVFSDSSNSSGRPSLFGGVGVGSLAVSAGSGASMLVLPEQSKPGIPVNSQGGLMLNYLEVAPSVEPLPPMLEPIFEPVQPKTSIVLEPIAKKISVEPIAKRVKFASIAEKQRVLGLSAPGLSDCNPCQ